MSNYYREGQIKDRLLDSGVHESEVGENGSYLIEFRDGRFSLDDINADWVKAEKSNPKTAHRWIGNVSTEDALYRKAFGLDGAPPNMTAQGQVVRQHGTKGAVEIAARYGATIGSAKRGVDPNPPDEAAVKKHDNNPWHNSPKNVDPKTGKYNASALQRQFALARASQKAADEIAASVGARPGDIRPGLLKKPTA